MNSVIICSLIFIFFSGVQADICNPVVPNCKNCYSNTTSCYQCNDEYSLINQLTSPECINCNLKYCDHCKQTNICYQCMNGYTLFDNQCILCSIQSCDLCASINVCSICSSTEKFLKPSCSGAECFACNVSNCLNCKSDDSCCKCSSGYKLETIGDFSRCVSVTCNINNCFVCQQQNSCSICQSGYNLNINNSCTACNVPNCKTCLTKDICSQCLNLFTLNSNINQCIACNINKCSVCSTSDVCATCTNDTDIYIPNQAGNQCIKCSLDNCLLCSSSNSCKTCQSGYQLLVNGSSGKICITCSITGCLNCNASNSCAQCTASFTLFNSTVCMSCNVQNCAFCNTANVCSTCNNNYTLTTSTNVCIACFIDKCLTCSSRNFCSKCQIVSAKVYYPNSNRDRCVLCQVNSCKTCTSDNSCGSCNNGYQLLINQTTGNTCISCLLPNCITCSSDSFCKTCVTGYYTLLDGSCFTCAAPCSTCNPNGKCKTCQTPIYVQSPLDDGTCYKPTVSNCKVYISTNTSICSQCIQNYLLNTTSNTCSFSCSINCKACTLDKPEQCISCQIGKYLNGTVCKDCTLGCDNCTSLTICVIASAGFYISSGQVKACPSYCTKCTGQNQCLQLTIQKSLGRALMVDDSNNTVLAKCAKNCLKCSTSNPQVCITCMDGFYITASGICYQCNSQCKTCLQSSTTCLTCFQNFKLNDDKTCVSCDDNCVTCSTTNTTFCLSCKQNQYLSPDNKCIDGCPANCKYCSNAKNCTTCYSGFQLYVDLQSDPVQIICVQCLINCRSCVEGNPGQCIQCGDGFYKSGDKCLPCSNHCEQCSSKGCITCYTGFTLTQSLTCARKCIFPCSTCSINNPSRCRSCYAGYTYDSVNQTCIDAITCTVENSCLACPAGYSIQSGICYKCEVQFCEKCVALNSSICTSCVINHYLSENVCNKCPDSCVDCFSANQCTQCVDGYYLSDKTKNGYLCIKCSQNCATCLQQQIKCLSCKQGWTLNGWKCQNTFKIVYQIKFNTNMFVFTRNYNKLMVFLASVVGSTNPYIISIYALWQGSVNINGTASIQAPNATIQATNNFNNFQTVLTYPYIADMPLQFSKTEYTGGQLAELNAATTNIQSLGIILGVSIPLGILILIGIGLIIIYRKKSHSKSSGDYQQNQREYKEGPDQSIERIENVEYSIF